MQSYDHNLAFRKWLVLMEALPTHSASPSPSALVLHLPNHPCTLPKLAAATPRPAGLMPNFHTMCHLHVPSPIQLQPLASQLTQLQAIWNLETSCQLPHWQEFPRRRSLNELQFSLNHGNGHCRDDLYNACCLYCLAFKTLNILEALSILKKDFNEFNIYCYCHS